MDFIPDDTDLLLLILLNKEAYSIRELAKESFKAVGTVQERLNGLQRYGYLDWTKGQHRSIRLTDRGVAYVRQNSRVPANKA